MTPFWASFAGAFLGVIAAFVIGVSGFWLLFTALEQDGSGEDLTEL